LIDEKSTKEEGDRGKSEAIKKRGRRPKGELREKIKSDRFKNKFVMDLSKDLINQGKVHDLIDQLNNKDFGEELTFKDLSLYAIGKINLKDIEKLQEMSLTHEQKLRRFWNESNDKNKTKLSFEEFLVKKLNIN
jgi:hypothetical protein